ncbi:MAG: hypothetical protein LBI15_08800 [Dysgonamonadaceae bacterium]|nr:hypothetical protein [Dysgonamonadaceae bacterium]
MEKAKQISYSTLCRFFNKIAHLLSFLIILLGILIASSERCKDVLSDVLVFVLLFSVVFGGIGAIYLKVRQINEKYKINK